MKFTKVIKAESLSEKYKADMDRMDSDYNAIKEKYTALQDLLLQLKSATFDVYQMTVGFDHAKELQAQAKKAWELANDAAWDGINNLHQAIVDTIYK